MKRIFALSVTVLMLCLTVISVSAQVIRLNDNADLIAEGAETEITQKLDDLSRQTKVDISVVTTDTLDGKTPRIYAEDFYLESGYADDGIILLISMEDNDVYIVASGSVGDKISSHDIDDILDEITPDLSNGDFDEAIIKYADLCGEYLIKQISELWMVLLVSVGIGIVIALIATGVMRSKHKTVRYKANAADYVKENSLNVVEARDIFLYFHIRRVPKPKNNSSSGRGNFSSGSGRKF